MQASLFLALACAAGSGMFQSGDPPDPPSTNYRDIEHAGVEFCRGLSNRDVTYHPGFAGMMLELRPAIRDRLMEILGEAGPVGEQGALMRECLLNRLGDRHAFAAAHLILLEGFVISPIDGKVGEHDTDEWFGLVYSFDYETAADGTPADPAKRPYQEVGLIFPSPSLQMARLRACWEGHFAGEATICWEESDEDPFEVRDPEE